MGLTTDDQVAIQALAARYNHAIDSGDGAAFAGVFTEDGVLDAAGRLVEGRAALEQFAKEFAQRMRSPRHIATNLVIEGNGHRATLRAYLQMFALEGEPGSQQIAASGKYADTLVKEAGTWRFERRVYTADA